MLTFNIFSVVVDLFFLVFIKGVTLNKKLNIRGFFYIYIYIVLKLQRQFCVTRKTKDALL